MTGWPADPPPEARRVSAVLPGWRTARTSLRVLFVIHSLTAAARLGDLISIFQDLRIQLFCTQTRDSMFPGGIGSFIQDCGFSQLTWEQAISIDFHAVICASLGDNLHEVKSPILRIPHGNGYNKRWNQRSAISDQRSAFGLSEETLKYDGRLIPAAIGLSHTEQLERLAEGCPDAVPRAFVAGDPCYDRILASLPRRLQYRRAFHLHSGQQLITVASTWQEDSLFGLDPLLVSRMLNELPYDRYRVALVLHPNIWASHSSFQIKAWLAEAQRAGLILIPPEEGWRAAIIAADWFVSDHGSISVYAAAAGRPVLLEKSAIGTIDTRSALGRLLDIAAALDITAPLEPQLRSAEELRTQTQAVATDWISSAPGHSLRLIRDELYRLMHVPPPDSDPVVLAVDLPQLDGTRPASLWTQIECTDAGTNRFSVRRHPAAIARPNRAGVLIVSDQELDHRLSALADVIWTTAEALPSDEKQRSADVMAHRPGVRLTVAQAGRQAVLRTRDGKTISVIIDRIDGPGEAELVFAVLAERLLSGAGDLLSLDPLALDLGSTEIVTAAFRVYVH